ncbi:MAG TPA: hypothetical protein VJ300_06070 [Thermoplasmata archaeon]|nr:hypothetical protein [Thermoplasmata archaeon]
MAKEHHCPTCGPATCNASNSRTHVCPRCATRWEETVQEGAGTVAPGASPA